MTISVTKVVYSGVHDRGVLVLPDWVRSELLNLEKPDINDLHTQSVIQKYPLGAMLKDWPQPGDRWRYCKAGETVAIGHQGFLKCNRNSCPGISGGAGSEAALYADAVAGQNYVDLTDTNSRAKNYYEGATMWLLNDTTGHYDEHRIIGNDVGTAAYCRVYIPEPGLRAAHTTTTGTVQVYRSIYSNVGSMLTGGGQPWKSALGMAHLPLTSAYYFWLHTAGEEWGTGASTWPGQTAYQRTVMANVDGSLIGKAAATYLYQTVGFLLEGTASDYGDVHFMLQLDQ